MAAPTPEGAGADRITQDCSNCPEISRPRACAQALTCVVAAYAGWWPLSIQTLCRALVAQRHPLAITPTREFIARLDAITPEQMAVVRREARQAIRDGVIPARSVDLRTTP
jgi:hypothetical protein